ncbi:MAG: hypothetical protein WCA15_20895 [Candidatus Acidiferrales bacterium]
MKTFCVFCLVVLPIALFAQERQLSSTPVGEIEPKVHFVTSGEWPLKWIGQTFTQEDQLQEVVLRNVSSQTIDGFQLGWVVFVPEGCGVTEAGVPRREMHLGPYEARKVGPGETVTVGPYHFSSDSITELARRAHSAAVVAQAGLYRVQFSGGAKTGMISTFEQTGSFGAEATAYPCQANKPVEANALQTFTSPDGAFQFKYSELLVRCSQSPKFRGSWEPADSCAAYFPVCDDPDSEGSATIACIAYPEGEFRDAPTFEAAAFSVAEIHPSASEKDCLSGSPDWNADQRASDGTLTINGVNFKVFEASDAGMSQSLDGQVYRTFHGDKCYELSVRMATASSAAFDPGSINEFSKEDENEVQNRLKQALDSFTFLK